MKIFYQVCILVPFVLRTGTASSVRGLQSAGLDCGFGRINVDRDCIWLDECLLEGDLYPCPSENAFCQDRSPDDFGFKCGCLSNAIAVLPTADGTVMLEGQNVPSIDGAPIEFRPLRCDVDTTSNPTTTPIGPGDVPVPGGPTVQEVQCDRNCVNDGEECVESGIANEQGLFSCTCLAGWRKTPGGGCTDIKQCDVPTLNDCAVGAVCVELAGGFPGFACVCPTGTIGGGFTECFDPNSAIEVSSTFAITLDGVTGVMDESEVGAYETVVKNELGEVDGFVVTEVTVTGQSFVEQEEVRGRRLALGTNRVTSDVIGRTTSSSSTNVVSNFGNELAGLLTSESVVDGLQSVDGISYFANVGITTEIETVSPPTPSTPPVAEPATPGGNATRSLLHDLVQVEDASKLAVFPIHRGVLPAKVVYVTALEMPEATINSILEAQGNDIEIKYFDNKMLAESVKKIALILEEQEGIYGAYETFLALKPWAYRSDLWRLMILWANGGIYIDADLVIKAPLDYWATLDDDQDIATCIDLSGHLPNRADGSDTQAVFYQAMLSAKKGSPVLLDAIRLIIDTVAGRRYGLEGKKESDLGITGPISFGKASQGSYNKIRTSCRLIRLTDHCEGTDCDVVQGYVPTSSSAPWLGLYSPITFAANSADGKSHIRENGFYGDDFAARRVYCEDGEACLV
jgi:hypothetical protein